MSISRTLRRTLPSTLVLALAVALGACSGSTNTQSGISDLTTRSTEAAAELGVEGAVVARSAVDVAVHDAPGGEVLRTLPATTEFGSARALLVVDRSTEWLEVALPERPNGSTGWIHGSTVELRGVDTRIEVSLSDRTLRLTEGDDTVLESEVAIGSDANPTPTGAFFVTDLIDTGEPNGAYGPFAIGLSAHSDTLSEFGGGDGQVGIHGTNDPSSIGQAVSHGCVRLPNAAVAAVVERVALGTPVEIVS